MKGAGVEAGEGNGGVGGMGDDMLSAIGSRVSVNEEADALCGMGTGPSVIDGHVDDLGGQVCGDDARGGGLSPEK
jgi:hypothetical protein